MKNQRISITDIARECGVSAMTVSRALRQSSKVHPDTLARILAKAEELGYFKSSRLGRPLCPSGNVPRRIHLILGGSGSTVSIFHSRLVNHIQRTLIRYNCECLLFSNDASYSGFLILLQALKRREADAHIIIGDFPDNQLKTLLMSFPGAILLDNPGIPEFDATFSSFNFDNVAGAAAMLKHLLDSGRRRILLLGGRKDHFFTMAMEQAYMELLPEYGIETDPKLIRYADFTAPGAADAMEKVIAEKIHFDAVFSNDEMALGVYRVLADHHISIPQDVAVAGCDNLPLGQMLYPALSTVDLDYGKLARAALDFLLEEKNTFSPCRIMITPELKLRESTN